MSKVPVHVLCITKGVPVKVTAGENVRDIAKANVKAATKIVVQEKKMHNAPKNAKAKRRNAARRKCENLRIRECENEIQKSS